MMKHFRVEGQWPLMIVHWPLAGSYEVVDEFCALIDGYLDRHESFALVQVMEATKQPGPQVRRYLAEKVKAQADRRRRYLRGVATVTSSMLIRGALTAIYWMTDPGYPHKVFADLDAAVEWARSQLA